MIDTLVKLFEGIGIPQSWDIPVTMLLMFVFEGVAVTYLYCRENGRISFGFHPKSKIGWIFAALFILMAVRLSVMLEVNFIF
jgi:hypothetical protein